MLTENEVPVRCRELIHAEMREATGSHHSKSCISIKIEKFSILRAPNLLEVSVEPVLGVMERFVLEIGFHNVVSV